MRSRVSTWPRCGGARFVLLILVGSVRRAWFTEYLSSGIVIKQVVHDDLLSKVVVHRSRLLLSIRRYVRCCTCRWCRGVAGT